jgi:hypothetical protein
MPTQSPQQLLQRLAKALHLNSHQTYESTDLTDRPVLTTSPPKVEQKPHFTEILTHFAKPHNTSI